VLARSSKRKRRYWDQPFGIGNKKKKNSSDADPERERLGG